MAITGHLLQLKQPGPWTLSSKSLDSVRAAQPKQCRSRFEAILGPVSTVQFGSERLRHGFGGRDGFCNLGFGGRAVAVAAAAAPASGEGETEERAAEVLVDEVEQEEENSNFPAEFKELIVDRGDPPNLYLYAAGFVVVVLMRNVILQEFARWGINLARIALYIGQGITLGVGKLMDVGAEPIALLTELASWATTIVGNVYTLIVDAPSGSLATTLFLSLAVLSIGDAATSKVTGSRSQLVGIAAAIGLAGILEVIPADIMLFGLVSLTVYANFIQKADLVTVFMPATVTFVAIASPLVRAAAFGLFLAISIYANWKSARQPEQTPSEVVASKRLSPVFLAIAASICISLSARFLSLRAVKWLLLRSA